MAGLSKSAYAARKPINVFGLGLGGVQLVKNPLTLDDNEVTLAQNAVPFTEGGVSGIRKRDGWQRVVPTGSVTPGTDAGGAILGGFVIDDPVGYSSPEGATAYASGYYLPPAGSWLSYTPDQGTYPACNSIYNYLSGFVGAKSTVYPPVAYPSTGAYYYGGHESGQILMARLAPRPFDSTVHFGVEIREAARVVGTGSTDDTYICAGMYNGNLVIALEGGGIWLFNPVSGRTTKLPDLAATATGAAEAFGRLWVASGLKLRSLGVDSNGNYDSSWTDGVTVSDAGITQLLGLARDSQNGMLFAGSYLDTGTLPAVLRVYAFTPAADGTATSASFPTDGTTGPFNGPASVQVNASPAFVAPFPMAIGDTRMYAIYVGSTDAFVQLLGGVGEDMAGASTRILSYDPVLKHWHNGGDTNTDDVRTDAMQSTAGNLAALAYTLDGRYQFAGGYYTSTGSHPPNVIRSRFDGTPTGWSLGSGSVVNNSFFDQPMVFF